MSAYTDSGFGQDEIGGSHLHVCAAVRFGEEFEGLQSGRYGVLVQAFVEEPVRFLQTHVDDVSLAGRASRLLLKSVLHTTRGTLHHNTTSVM